MSSHLHTRNKFHISLHFPFILAADGSLLNSGMALLVLLWLSPSFVRMEIRMMVSNSIIRYIYDLLSHSENTQPLIMTYKVLPILNSTHFPFITSELGFGPTGVSKIKSFKFCILIFSIQNNLLPVHQQMGSSCFFITYILAFRALFQNPSSQVNKFDFRTNNFQFYQFPYPTALWS